ncbi:hypothetical protein [Paraburkholderia youngii]|uniref:hypothetical protein n=1 Tax=Paraburkholderia youngii TaxID=2782701 RepID=UPI003D194536
MKNSFRNSPPPPFWRTCVVFGVLGAAVKLTGLVTVHMMAEFRFGGVFREVDATFVDTIQGIVACVFLVGMLIGSWVARWPKKSESASRKIVADA